MATVDRGYWNQLQGPAERRYGLPPGLLDRVMDVESSYLPDVVSGERRSSAGAIGPYQFMPATARGLGIDPLDPEQATEGAARLLRENLDRRGGDLRLALADYNAGPGVTNAVLAGRRGYKPETVKYMASFEDFYGSNPTPDWATLQQSPPSEAPPGRSMAAAQLPSASPPPPSGAGGPSQLDAIMMELLQPPPPRERSPWDAIQMLGMGILSSQNPQAFQGMAMLQNMIEGRERAERQERQDRAMMALQYAQLQNRGQQLPRALQEAQMFQSRPDLLAIDIQRRQAMRPPAPLQRFQEGPNMYVWDPNNPGAPPQYLPTASAPQPVTAEQARQRETQRETDEIKRKEWFDNRLDWEDTLATANAAREQVDRVEEMANREGVSPLNAVVRLWDQDKASFVAAFQELANSATLEKLAQIGGSDTEKEYQWLRELAGSPTDWTPATAREFFLNYRRLVDVARRKTRDRLLPGYRAYGVQQPSWMLPPEEQPFNPNEEAEMDALEANQGLPQSEQVSGPMSGVNMVQ